MPTRIYPYLGEANIAISAPENLLERLERNIEERPIKGGYEGIVKVEEGEFREIKKDKTFKYASAKSNCESSLKGYDYFRYNTLVRTIWRENDKTFHVKNHLQDDETGALKCFKNIYYSLPQSREKSLIHSSSIDLNGRGILIVGGYRSGKTTLTFKFLEELSAKLVEGGNTLISFKNNLKAHYLPRVLYARLSTISSSPYLYHLIKDINCCDAQQTIDKDALERIILSKAFHVNAELCFSREKLHELFGRNVTCSETHINRVIFPEYSADGPIQILDLHLDEAYNRIVDREFPKDTSIGKLLHQTEMSPPPHSSMKKKWFENLKFKKVVFSSWNDLTRSLLEDLLS